MGRSWSTTETQIRATANMVAECKGNRNEAARKLGISQMVVRRRLDHAEEEIKAECAIIRESWGKRTERLRNQYRTLRLRVPVVPCRDMRERGVR